MENLQAVGTKVLIKPDPVEEIKQGKIASIKVRKDSLLRGQIISIGGLSNFDMDCVGKFCYYAAYGYEELNDFVFVDQADVFAVEK